MRQKGTVRRLNTWAVEDLKNNYTAYKENRKLVTGLKKEGKRVIKAQETGNSKSPWNFVQA
ncbi:MAG: hypothetical protein AAB521_04265 [Patescibacteria group bacterium]